MSQELVLSLAKEAIVTMLVVSAPLLIAGMVVGVSISIFQTATSIQDQTLTFIPKIIVVMLALLVSLPWMMQVMAEYVTRLYGQLYLYVR